MCVCVAQFDFDGMEQRFGWGNVAKRYFHYSPKRPCQRFSGKQMTTTTTTQCTTDFLYLTQKAQVEDDKNNDDDDDDETKAVNTILQCVMVIDPQ